jgi:chromosome segregation ATPase
MPRPKLSDQLEEANKKLASKEVQILQGKAMMKQLDLKMDLVTEERDTLGKSLTEKIEEIEFLKRDFEQLKIDYENDIRKIKIEEEQKLAIKFNDAVKIEKKKTEEIYQRIVEDLNNKIKKLEEDNSLLKDVNDELRIENENLKIENGNLKLVNDASSEISEESNEEINPVNRESEIRQHLINFTNSRVEVYPKHKIKCADFRKAFQRYLIEKGALKLSRFEYPDVIRHMSELGFINTRSDTNYYKGIYIPN